MLAEGFEEIEALATLDILRRCGLEVTTVSNTSNSVVTGAHGIPVTADNIYDSTKLLEAQAIILPGGMPGAKNLLLNEELHKVLVALAEKNKIIAAICAAPMVLGQHGLLAGKKATCYPGFETQLTDATHMTDYVVEDGNIITGKGPAAAVEFGFTIASRFVSTEQISQVKAGMLF